MKTESILKDSGESQRLTNRSKVLRIALAINMVLFVFSSFAQQDANPQVGMRENEQVIGVVKATITKTNYRSPDSTEVYSKILEQARKEFPDVIFELRNVEYARGNYYNIGNTPAQDFLCSAEVVGFVSFERKANDASNSSYSTEKADFVFSEEKINEALKKAVDKVMSKVGKNARFAINQVSAPGGLDKETVKDQLLDILLDKEYKVVAKEYLEKQQGGQQTSGSSNGTTTKTNDSSGVGYYLNLRVNEKSVRVQVINVSTGEYEGNATVEF